MQTVAAILILGGLAGSAYAVWQLVRRVRRRVLGRGDAVDHLPLRVVAIASVTALTLGAALSSVTSLDPSGPARPYAPGVGPPPPPGPTQEALKDIDAILRGLPFATVAFNAPTNIALGESAVIELLLSTEDPIEDLKQEVTQAGERVGARIQISDRMEARLTGQRFKIQAITPELQAVSGSELSSWRWEIEPTATGRQRLHLTLTAMLVVRGSRSARMVRTFQRTLTVDVSLSKRVTNFLENNWQWLWTTIVVPGGLWYAARRKRQSRRDPQAPGAAAGA